MSLRLNNFVLAGICVAAAWGLRHLLEPVLQGDAPLLAFVLPPVIVAMRGAAGAALFAAVLGTVIGTVWFVDPVGQLWPTDTADRVRVLMFIGQNLVVVALAATLQYAKSRASEAAAAAQDSSRLVEAIVQTTPHAILTTDHEGRVLTWNRAAEDMFGWRAEEVLGRYLPHVPESADADAAPLRARALAGEQVLNVPVERRRKTGETIHCALSLTPLRQGDTIRGVVATLVDMTQLRALEAQLRQSQKMEAVGQLAAGVAHDFNNQLTAILGYAELARDTLPAGAAAREDLAEIMRAGQSAASLTRQLLAFSRQQILQVRAMDVVSAIRGTEKLLRRAIRQDVTIQLALPAEALWIRADVAQFEHILLNLVVNARDAMPQGGTVSIAASAVFLDEAYSGTHLDVSPGEFVMVSVTDTGEGIPKEIQARIFEPFFTTKEPGKGTGLGLAMVYGTVRQMGGAIWVYSEPGHGTTFKLYFPRISEGGAAFEAEREVVTSRGHERLLLVDDDDLVRDVAVRALEQAGYTVLAFASPWEALGWARQAREPVDLLVADVVMPGMSGPELAQTLIGGYGLNHVLYTSGYSDQPHLREQIERGAVHFIGKPFTPSELRTAVRRALDHRPPGEHVSE